MFMVKHYCEYVSLEKFTFIANQTVSKEITIFNHWSPPYSTFRDETDAQLSNNTWICGPFIKLIREVSVRYGYG